MQLVSLVYKLTRDFPKEEIYGLVSQMRRCAVSIPSNIAEGSQRNSDKEFTRFLSISKASAAELETQLLLSKDLNFILDEELYHSSLSLLLEIRKMISGLRKSLSNTS